MNLASVTASARVSSCLLPLALLLGAGCTTINTVGGGSRPGEFYVVTTKSFLMFPGHPKVLECHHDDTTSTVCELVLTRGQAAEYTATTFDDCREAGAYDRARRIEPRIDEVLKSAGIPADKEQACRNGYASGLAK